MRFEPLQVRAAAPGGKRRRRRLTGMLHGGAWQCAVRAAERVCVAAALGRHPPGGFKSTHSQSGLPRWVQGEIPPAASEVTLLLWSGGADAPRPITLRKNKRGFWKVADFAALLAPVRPPAAPLHTAADDL